MYSDATSPSTLAYSSDRINPSRGQGKGDGSSSQAGCLQFGSHRNGGKFLACLFTPYYKYWAQIWIFALKS